tara:strand:- start:843 stop:1607 length:765 start_codon:yes stop_codon:yes gene_type:complete
MSDYTKATNFASKDALPTGNALKTLSGTEIDDEFNNIATAVATKANSSNAALTGVPVAPTAATATNTTQVATTAHVQANAALKAPLASPTFTGTPTAPTATAGTNTTQVATTAYTTTAIAAIPAVTAAVVNALAYPVGAIYTSTVSTNPATTLGIGTWSAFGAGRVLLGDGGGYSAGATGGATTDSHALSTAEMPSHTHTVTHGLSNSGSTSTIGTHDTSAGESTTTSATGSGAAHTHDIVQPYIVVYFWKRTA